MVNKSIIIIILYLFFYSSVQKLLEWKKSVRNIYLDSKLIISSPLCFTWFYERILCYPGSLPDNLYDTTKERKYAFVGFTKVI